MAISNVRRNLEGAGSLEAEIQMLERTRSEDDPKLIASAERLQELKRRPSEIEAEIKKLEAELVEKEKMIAQEVLAGGAAAVSGLSKLREKIADLKEEGRIFDTVIDHASQKHQELKTTLKAERTQRCRDTLNAALFDLAGFFEGGREKIAMVKQAAHLAGILYVKNEIEDLERVLRGLAGHAEAK